MCISAKWPLGIWGQTLPSVTPREPSFTPGFALCSWGAELTLDANLTFSSSVSTISHVNVNVEQIWTRLAPESLTKSHNCLSRWYFFLSLLFFLHFKPRVLMGLWNKYMSVDYSGIKSVREALPFFSAGLNDHLVLTSVVLSRALGRGGCGSDWRWEGGYFQDNT